MTRHFLVVEQARLAHVQDLGRPGLAKIGVSPNGAADQHAARTANVLVGNAETAPLIEVTGSEFAVHCTADTLVAVTGAAEAVLVDGQAQPAWELLPVRAGCSVRVPPPIRGLRSYLAFNGLIRAPIALGSVGPDPLLEIGPALVDGEELIIDSEYVAPSGDLFPLYRLGARRPTRPVNGTARIDVTPGPDLDQLSHGVADLDAIFQVMPDSDQVGLRLDGPPVTLRTTEEILSRGVPVGAVQVPRSGGAIVLLRGRLVTAGYPIVAVATTVSLDTLGQLRPGDRLRFRHCTTKEAVGTLRALSDERLVLAARVRAALASRGLANVLERPTNGPSPS